MAALLSKSDGARFPFTLFTKLFAGPILWPSIARKTQFRACAAICRETAGLAARREHPVARHNDREGVSRESLSHGAGRTGGSCSLRERAIGRGRAERNGARGLIDPAMERRQTIHIERGEEIAWRATQKRYDGIPRLDNLERRRRLLRSWISLQHAVMRLCFR